MTNGINQTWNDYSIDLFYWMEANTGVTIDTEAMYRSLSWVEDDNECSY